MIIRQEQLRIFRDHSIDDFVRRVRQHLRDNSGPEVEQFSDEKLTFFVRDGIEKAQKYGIAREPNIAAFVRMTFAVSASFYEHPAIARVLTDAATPPDARVSRLFREVTEQEWFEASSRSGNREYGRD